MEGPSPGPGKAVGGSLTHQAPDGLPDTPPVPEPSRVMRESQDFYIKQEDPVLSTDEMTCLKVSEAGSPAGQARMGTEI